MGSGNTFIAGDTIDKIEFTIKRGADTVLTQEVTTKQENGGKRGKAFLNFTPEKTGTYTVTIRAHSQSQGWVE